MKPEEQVSCREEPRYPLLSLTRLRFEVDGEGVTTLIAGAGCPLHCRWCINGNILQKPPQLVTPRELYDRVKIDDLYFQATGGGVTFGGGEALLHTDFIRAFREICGNRWRIYAETALQVPEEAISDAAEQIDGFIVDIKSGDEEIYRAYTGGELSVALRNLKLLLKLVGAERIQVRVPLIPQYNNKEDQEKTAALLREMGITRIELFDYVLRDFMTEGQAPSEGNEG